MFRGSMVALVTPMTTDNVIDVATLEQLVDWHIAAKTDAIVVCGTTGEAPTLTTDERKIILEVVIKRVKRKLPVIAGTGTYATENTIFLTKQAMELGADACLLVTPYYNKPTQAGLYQHFKTVAEAVPIPQILYNVPARTGVDLQAKTVGELASIPNIIGIKEATGSMARVLAIVKHTQAHPIDIYSGDDKTGIDCLSLGGRGIISVTANVAPAAMHEMCIFMRAGHPQRAAQIAKRLAPLHDALFVESNPIPTKWALHAMGRIPQGIRLPLTPLSKDHHETVQNALKAAGVYDT